MEVTRLATRSLEARGESVGLRHYAVAALGRFGSKEDVAMLEPLLKDESVCCTVSDARRQNAPIKTQVRDIALAVAIRLSGEDPRDYGFENPRESAETLYSFSSLGFREDAKREAVHAKWAARGK